MPLIYLNCPKDTFSAKAKDDLVLELTDIALKIERLPNTAFIRSTVWIYINEYPALNVFHGGTSAGTSVISLEVNVFKGGLDPKAKELLIQEFTEAIRKKAGLKEGEPVPVFIVIRDVPESNWGVFGGTITLNDFHNPSPDAVPIP